MDTLQYDDYSLYVGDIFDPNHKKERHEKEFPKCCQQAFELGAGLVKG